MTAGSDAPHDWSATDADYLSPAYLRLHVRQMVAKHPKGIYWLRAPKGMGKTQLVRSFTGKRPSKKDPGKTEPLDGGVAADARTIAVHLRPGDGPSALADGLKAAFDAELGLSADEQAQTAATLRDDPEGARADFAAWLARLRGIVAEKGGRRLIVCVDGLDRAAEPALALLPSVAEVPADVTLLLTSRPAADWPLHEAARARIGEGEGLTAVDLTYQEKDYVDLLRKYYVERLRALFQAKAIAHLQQLCESNTPFEKGGRDERLTADPTLRDELKREWKKLTNKFPRFTGQQLPVPPILWVLDQRDKLWTDMMDRTEQRFDLFAAITARLVAGSLAVEQVEALPRGEALLTALG